MKNAVFALLAGGALAAPQVTLPAVTQISDGQVQGK